MHGEECNIYLTYCKADATIKEEIRNYQDCVTGNETGGLEDERKCGGSAWDFSILYLTVRKEDYEKIKKRNCKIRVIAYTIPKQIWYNNKNLRFLRGTAISMILSII